MPPQILDLRPALMHRPSLALAALLALPLAACAQPTSPPAGSADSAAAAAAPSARPSGAAVPASADASVAAPNIAWHASFPDALAASKASGKKVLVEVWASWCGYCRKMQREVYPSAEVQAVVGQYFEAVRVDGELATDSIPVMGMSASSQMLARALGAEGYPTTAFLTSDGRKITHLPGYSPAADFALVLRYIGTDAYTGETFDVWRARETGQPVPAQPPAPGGN